MVGRGKLPRVRVLCGRPLCYEMDPTHGSHTWIPHMDPTHGSHTWIPHMDPTRGSHTRIPHMDPTHARHVCMCMDAKLQRLVSKTRTPSRFHAVPCPAAPKNKTAQRHAPHAGLSQEERCTQWKVSQHWRKRSPSSARQGWLPILAAPPALVATAEEEELNITPPPPSLSVAARARP